VAPGESLGRAPRYVLSNSFAFGGSNAVPSCWGAPEHGQLDTSLRLQVADLVPHRGSHELAGPHRQLSTPSRVVAEADVAEAQPVPAQRAAAAWIGIEYMAQAIAAWAGHRARARGDPSRWVSWWARVAMMCNASPSRRAAACASRHTCELMADNGLGMFACRILVGGELAASANLSVFEPPEGDGISG
jgi:predicted hotdog family 3-hydroxylacyl-ACP dehydratase